MTKKAFICGNWKLNHNISQTREATVELINRLEADQNLAENADIVIAPVISTIFSAQQEIEKHNCSNLKLAAQNVFHKDSGAFTGEWSCEHLKELGCEFAIVGHSERRQYFGETSESVALKAQACLESQIIPIVCVGETLDERKSGNIKAVLEKQLGPIEKILSDQIIVAYEPVWAIGTGLTATPEQAEEVHDFIREKLDKSKKIKIIYGGSAKPDNAQSLLAQNNIDGLLVGGASLNPKSFLSIVTNIST